MLIFSKMPVSMAECVVKTGATHVFVDVYFQTYLACEVISENEASIETQNWIAIMHVTLIF